MYSEIIIAIVFLITFALVIGSNLGVSVQVSLLTLMGIFLGVGCLYIGVHANTWFEIISAIISPIILAIVGLVFVNYKMNRTETNLSSDENSKI